MNKRTICAAMAFALLFCSCGVNENDAYETDLLSETAPISASENVESTSETLAEIEEDSVETIEFITERETETDPEEIPAETVTGTTTTENPTDTEPFFDKDTPPVITVSNTDYKTNHLEWTAVEGAQSYMLYLLDEVTEEFEEYGEISGTACNDNDLAQNTKYTYTAAAVFTDGSMGKMSEPVSVYTKRNGIYSANKPLGLAIEGDDMYFRSPTSDAVKHVLKRKIDRTDDWFEELCMESGYYVRSYAYHYEPVFSSDRIYFFDDRGVYNERKYVTEIYSCKYDSSDEQYHKTIEDYLSTIIENDTMPGVRYFDVRLEGNELFFFGTAVQDGYLITAFADLEQEKITEYCVYSNDDLDLLNDIKVVSIDDRIVTVTFDRTSGDDEYSCGYLCRLDLTTGTVINEGQLALCDDINEIENGVVYRNSRNNEIYLCDPVSLRAYRIGAGQSAYSYKDIVYYTDSRSSLCRFTNGKSETLFTLPLKWSLKSSTTVNSFKWNDESYPLIQNKILYADSDRIIFLLDVQVEVDHEYQIWTMNTDGSDLRMLCSEYVEAIFLD